MNRNIYAIEKVITDFVFDFIVPKLDNYTLSFDKRLRLNNTYVTQTTQVKDMSPFMNYLNDKYIYFISIWKVLGKKKDIINLTLEWIWLPISNSYQYWTPILITTYWDRVFKTDFAIPIHYKVLFETNILEYYIKEKWTKIFSMFYNKYRKYYEKSNIPEKEFLQQTLWKYYKK